MNVTNTNAQKAFGHMMMHEDEDPWPAGHGAVCRNPTALDLPLLSRDDTTWKEFQGSDSIAESALTGGVHDSLC